MHIVIRTYLRHYELEPELIFDDLFSLHGKVALITGGGRGIGMTIAEAYLEAGAAVVITGRRVEYLDATVAEFAGRGLDISQIVSDVSTPDGVRTAVEVTLKRHGSIDILVNNAGQTWGQPTEDLALERWQKIMDVNLTGVFQMSQAVGQHMIARSGGGKIINISSLAGLTAGATSATKTIAYNTSKAGVIAFTRTLASEWGRHGILVNAIAPGWFPTRMAASTIEANRAGFEAASALGRLGELDELRGVAIFLASAASSYITGQTIVVDGGSSL